MDTYQMGERTLKRDRPTGTGRRERDRVSGRRGTTRAGKWSPFPGNPTLLNKQLPTTRQIGWATTESPTADPWSTRLIQNAQTEGFRTEPDTSYHTTATNSTRGQIMVVLQHPEQNPGDEVSKLGSDMGRSEIGEAIVKSVVPDDITLSTKLAGAEARDTPEHHNPRFSPAQIGKDIHTDAPLHISKSTFPFSSTANLPDTKGILTVSASTPALLSHATELQSSSHGITPDPQESHATGPEQHIVSQRGTQTADLVTVEWNPGEKPLYTKSSISASVLTNIAHTERDLTADDLTRVYATSGTSIVVGKDYTTLHAHYEGDVTAKNSEHISTLQTNIASDDETRDSGHSDLRTETWISQNVTDVPTRIATTIFSQNETNSSFVKRILATTTMSSPSNLPPFSSQAANKLASPSPRRPPKRPSRKRPKKRRTTVRPPVTTNRLSTNPSENELGNATYSLYGSTIMSSALMTTSLPEADLPSNITSSTLVSAGLATVQIVGISAACLLLLCILITPIICCRLRNSKTRIKRRGGQGTDGMSHALMEEMIRLEMARGRAKLYKTSVDDERELQCLPSGQQQDSPVKLAINMDGLSQQHEVLHSAISTSTSYEKTPPTRFSSTQRRKMLGVQTNMCYDGTPSKDQLEQLSQKQISIPVSTSSIDKRMVPIPAWSIVQHIEAKESPPPLPPRIPLRRKLVTTVCDEKSTQTPPWEHRRQRHLNAKLTPKSRKKSPKLCSRIIRSASTDEDDHYVDCMTVIHTPRAPQRIYNFTKTDKVTPTPTDIIREPSILPRCADASTNDDFYHSDTESLDSLDTHHPYSLRSPGPVPVPGHMTSQQVLPGTRRFNNNCAYVAIQDTAL